MIRDYRDGEPLAPWAVEVAREKLAGPLPKRWTQVQATIALAEEIADAYGPDGDLVVAASALHDVGWAPDVLRTDFPALDAAPFLESIGTPTRLLNLCVNYSAAAVEARLRGRDAEMARYPDERTPVRDAVWFTHLSIGGNAARMTIDERIQDFWNRYGDHPVGGPWIEQTEPLFREAVERTRRHLASAGHEPLP